MKTRILLTALLLTTILLCGAAHSGAQKPAKPINPKKLDALTSAALEAMKQKAADLKVAGVAVVSWVPGDSVQAWTSKMAVVGRLTDPAAAPKGNNLLAIAYAKSAEMARTLVNSGTSTGPIMTGEFGWQGGVTEHIRVGKTGSAWLIVAFSGGKSEDDVEVSKAGLAVMKAGTQ